MPSRSLDLFPKYLGSLFDFHLDGQGLSKMVMIGVVAVSSYIFPTKDLQDAAVASGALVLIDTVTGTITAFSEKKVRSSMAFSRVLVKVLAYLSVCAVAAIVEKIIFKNSGLSITMGVLWLVIATEGISVIENVERISGGRFRLLRALLGRVLDNDKEAEKQEKANV